MQMITVIIADRNKTSRTVCLGTLQPEKGISVVGVARSGLEAVMATARLKPDILLLNLNLTEGKRNNLLRALRQKSPQTKMILFARRAREGPILEGLARGARGYLQETAITTFLPKAVRAVEAGEAWLPRKLEARIIDRLARQATLERAG